MSRSSPGRKRDGAGWQPGGPFGTVGEYLATQPRDKRAALERLRKTIRASRGTVRFSPEKPLPASLVRRIVRARVAQNAARDSAVRSRNRR